MKKYISIIALALGLLSTSCSEDTNGLTGITYYAVIELEGPTYMIAPAGTPFVDPGYSATMQGEDITSQVKVSTNMDTQNPKPGYYSIVYSAVNPDGFSASSQRYVLIADADDKASGFYTTTGDTNLNGSNFFGVNACSITVYGNGDGTYHISDLLGGFYAQVRGYGSAYALEGEVEIDADGNITLLDSYLAGWGDSANALTNGKLDAEAGTMSWTCDYTEYNYLFNVTIAK